MNKLLQFGALFCCLCLSQGIAADNNNNNCCPEKCPEDHPCPDTPTNDAYRLYVHYEPCYYTTKRCCEERIPCKKKCYRKVPRYYEVERCRMVPEKYCETVCKYETECYEVDDCKVCKKWVCDTHCKYVPKYYWKHECEPVPACAPACN